MSFQISVQNALLVQSEHAEAYLDEDLEHVRFLDRSVRASFASEQALKVAILAELHHYIDFSTGDEGIIVFYCIRVINELPMYINFIQGLQSLASRHQIRLQLLHNQMLNRLAQFPYRCRILAAFGGRVDVERLFLGVSGCGNQCRLFSGHFVDFAVGALAEDPNDCVFVPPPCVSLFIGLTALGLVLGRHGGTLGCEDQ